MNSIGKIPTNPLNNINTKYSKDIKPLNQPTINSMGGGAK